MSGNIDRLSFVSAFNENTYDSIMFVGDQWEEYVFAAFLDVPEEQQAKMNIRDGMIRVSTGLEGVDDLIADFDQALAII